MTEQEFTRWLQGWVELENGKTPTADQWKMIVDHLKLVYQKVTPELDDNSVWEDKKVNEEDKTVVKKSSTLDDLLEMYKKFPVMPSPAPTPFMPHYPGQWLDTGKIPVPPGTVIC
jgi:hypothetical protein